MAAARQLRVVQASAAQMPIQERERETSDGRIRLFSVDRGTMLRPDEPGRGEEHFFVVEVEMGRPLDDAQVLRTP